MITAWLGAKALFGLSRGLWLIIAAFGLVMAWLLTVERERADDRRNQEIGAQVQREADLRETLDRVEQANETREQVSAEARAGSGDELYALCLQSARTPENCQRFMPKRAAD